MLHVLLFILAGLETAAAQNTTSPTTGSDDNSPVHDKESGISYTRLSMSILLSAGIFILLVVGATCITETPTSRRFCQRGRRGYEQV